MQTKRLRILVYAENYPWGMGPALVEAFRKLNCDAEIFDWTRWLYTSRKVSLKNRICDRLLFPLVASKINLALTAFLNGKTFDCVVVTKGLHLFPETVAKFKSYSMVSVNWNPDDFFNPLNSSVYLRAAFGLYDCIFTPRDHLIQEYLDRGAKDVRALSWYYCPEIQYPVTLGPADNAKYASDLVFIGSWSTRREKILSALSQFSVKIWGGGWHKASVNFRERIKCSGPIYVSEMTKAICASKINLNILTVENRDTTNIRNFEIPACGAFQLCERSAAVLKLFKEDKEIVCFADGPELLAKCKYYLKNEAEREQVVSAGRQRILSGSNTILDRAKEIIAVVEKMRVG